MAAKKFTTEKVAKPAKKTTTPKPATTEPATSSTSSATQSTTSESKKPITNQAQTTMPKSTKKSPASSFIIALVMIVLGVGTGYFLYTQTSSPTVTSAEVVEQAIPDSSDEVVVGEVYGAENGDTFTDEAEGVLVKGGIEGEGSHHILREGGPSRNVYLTSSVLDLNLFNEHAVIVWGETFQAQKAGWLMDVGRVEVVALNAEKPFEEEVEEEVEELEEEL